MSKADTIKGNRPGIRIRKGKIMAINRNVLRLLGCPKHIIFWCSPKAHTLFIAADDGNDACSFPVNEIYYHSSTNGFQLGNSKFIRAVKEFADWNENATCAVDGKYLDSLGMVAFNLGDTRIKEEHDYE